MHFEITNCKEKDTTEKLGIDIGELYDVNCDPLSFQASTIDGRRKGACLFCQEYFMDLYLLAELKTISLKVSFLIFSLETDMLNVSIH